jgi:rare lipoprotein A
MKPIVTLALASMALLCSPAALAQEKKSVPAADKPQLDRSGNTQKGRASYYGKSFAGKKMADGTPMDPNENVAASRTLPLGTRAEVVNLENGKSREVEIRDRGPYVDGRIVDVSPKVARELDMHKDGVAPVLVRPIEVPQADGSTKAGSGASGSTGSMVGSSGAGGSLVSSHDTHE